MGAYPFSHIAFPLKPGTHTWNALRKNIEPLYETFILGVCFYGGDNVNLESVRGVNAAQTKSLLKSHCCMHTGKHMAKMLFQLSRAIIINLLVQIAITCNLKWDQKFKNEKRQSGWSPWVLLCRAGWCTGLASAGAPASNQQVPRGRGPAAVFQLDSQSPGNLLGLY